MIFSSTATYWVCLFFKDWLSQTQSKYAQQYQQTYLRKSVDEGIGSPIFLIMAGVFGVVAVGGAK